MASFVNKSNVVLYCAVQNDEILLFRSLNSDKNSCESYKLKCPIFHAKDASKPPQVSQLSESRIIFATVSNCGKVIAACDSNNLLHLWICDANIWSHKSERKLARKCHKIIFTNSGSEAIVADRGGDVFVFSAIEVMKEGKFLLGHISLIVDIAISSADQYLLTCDRDGKIRVSHYPNSYNIYSYCLGHEEFVSSVQNVLLSQELILSGSGDSTLRLWKFCGNNVCTVNLFENECLYAAAETCKGNGDSKISLSCLLDEKQSILAVKCVKFASETKMCAISFYYVNGVAIYHISASEDIECNFIQFISTESIPFDIFFNNLGDLIILQKTLNKQYSYLKYSENSELCFQEIDSSTVNLIKEFEKVCDNLENLCEGQDKCEMLFKKNFDDNVDEKDKSKKCKME